MGCLVAHELPIRLNICAEYVNNKHRNLNINDCNGQKWVILNIVETGTQRRSESRLAGIANG